jgi:hypothetical protein
MSVHTRRRKFLIDDWKKVLNDGEFSFYQEFWLYGFLCNCQSLLLLSWGFLKCKSSLARAFHANHHNHGFFGVVLGIFSATFFTNNQIACMERVNFNKGCVTIVALPFTLKNILKATKKKKRIMENSNIFHHAKKYNLQKKLL